MRHELETAFVLHTRAYRETSMLLEVFTESLGRMGLVARGARRPRAHLRGVLRPFQLLLLSWTGRGELGTLTGAETREAPYLISGPMLAGGLYLNELLLRLLARDDPHPDLFQCYRLTLQQLGRPGANPEPALRLFEKHLLRELGYALLLEHEAQGGPEVQPGTLYRYDLESGPVAVPTAPPGELVLRGESLLALARERLEDVSLRREVKSLTRAALNHYLGHKPVRSRELWRKPIIKNH